MSEPRTEAGRRLLGWLRVMDAGELPPPIETGRLAILAIEAEAASPEPAPLDEVREAAHALLDEMDAEVADNHPLKDHYRRQAVERLRAALAALPSDRPGAEEREYTADELDRIDKARDREPEAREP